MRNLTLILLAFAALNIFSCKEPDPCAETLCINDGTCTDGLCDCPYWTTGTHCELSLLKQKYEGNYSVQTWVYYSQTDTFWLQATDTFEINLWEDSPSGYYYGDWTFETNAYYQLAQHSFTFSNLEEFKSTAISDTFPEKITMSGKGIFIDENHFEENDTVFTNDDGTIYTSRILRLIGSRI